MNVLPNELKLVLEGLIQVPLEEQIEEYSGITHIDTSIYIKEDIGYQPFLVEVYIPSFSYSYIAKKQVGYYHLTQLLDEPIRLNICIPNSISKVIGIHIILKNLSKAHPNLKGGLHEWEGISNRVLLTSIKDELLLDVYSPNGCNLVFLKDSLFFHTGIESINELVIK
jgi:hypothetical protein